MNRDLRVDTQRLLGRIDALGEIGALKGGGVCRLALSDEDKAGRDRVLAWMEELGLRVTVDPIGNVIGVRPGLESGPPVMTGSHLDTVSTGGLYDGALGVLAGLEVVETLNEAGLTTRRPLAVAFFTNEEGCRFQPDMMGSQVFQGGLALADALASVGIDGTTVGENLQRIGVSGDGSCGQDNAVHAFVELHVEQGPVLAREGAAIGAVEGVQGISWAEFTVEGVSNHAGTTPMSLRHDAGYIAGAVIQYVRWLTGHFGGSQLGTVGHLRLFPDLVNVIPSKAVFTVDLRNTDGEVLAEAARRIQMFLNEMARREGVTVSERSLARFDPVSFDPGMIAKVELAAEALGYRVRRLPSGAGHDAQILSRLCPTAMIFTPSVDGISHNVAELTRPEDIEAGANVLLHVLLDLAS